MADFIVFGSAARTADENSSTLSLPQDRAIRCYVDITVDNAGAYTIHVEELIGATWFSLGNSGSLTGVGQTSFLASAPKTSGKVRVRLDSASGDMTFSVRLALADQLFAAVGHNSISIASAARQADVTTDPFNLPASADVLLYLDITAVAGDDTVEVALQEQVGGKWYTLGTTGAIAVTGQTVIEIRGPRSNGALRVFADHVVVTTADDITYSVRLAA